MGTSTNGVLAYGYNLSDGDEWLIKEVGEYGQPKLDWYDDREEAEDGFVGQAEAKLLIDVAGFTETDWRADGYFARKKAADALVGVEFEHYCHSEYPMYVLAAHVITVHRGDSKLLNLGELAADPARQGWDVKLAAAAKALGITPRQAEPGWILCSYWG
jgi:hypothetical protein